MKINEATAPTDPGRRSSLISYASKTGPGLIVSPCPRSQGVLGDYLPTWAPQAVMKKA